MAQMSSRSEEFCWMLVEMVSRVSEGLNFSSESFLTYYDGQPICFVV